MTRKLDGIVLPLAVLGSSVAVAPSRPNPPDFRLHVVPSIVYKVDDPGGSRTSSFVFDIAVLCSKDCELTPTSARVELSSAGNIVERQDWTAEMLTKIKRTSDRIEPNTPVMATVRAIALPEAFELRFYFREPLAWAIDSLAMRLTVADANGHRAEHMVGIPIGYYHQKTALIFPIRGQGIIGQDYVTNGGHGGHGDFSDEFGIDIDGLDQNFGELSDSNENAADAGWGREILAPATGIVVYARNDVPTNPHPGFEPGDDWYRPLHDPVNASAGNCVIIDHGNSEYSVMMHMQTGSVTVKPGDRVAAGQVIGKLGNSGDAFGPHLHYQLQSGPQLWKYQSMPVRFQNVDGPLHRGQYFVAK
ncbi:MAG: M23 family metallopeptidase [Gemmatimonadaceae bacterium]